MFRINTVSIWLGPHFYTLAVDFCGIQISRCFKLFLTYLLCVPFNSFNAIVLRIFIAHTNLQVVLNYLDFRCATADKLKCFYFHIIKDDLNEITQLHSKYGPR